MNPPEQESASRSLHLPKMEQALQQARGRTHLLAIAIDDYLHCGKLANAVNDARALISVLVESYEFDPAFVYTLFDQEATYEKIDDALRSLSDKVEPGKDSVIIFFSGHGLYDEHLDDAFWIPVDAHFDRNRDYFPYDRIMRHVRAIPSLHTFLIVDSCYSGSVLVRERNLVGERLEKDPSRWILASGRNEVVPDGVQGENSPFTTQLVNTLECSAHEGIPVMSLVDQVTRNTAYNSRQTPIGQPLQDVGHQGGQFIFHPKKDEKKEFDAACKKGTGEAYRLFIKQFPNGKYAEQASWLLAKTVDNLAEYRAYVSKYPEGPYIQEALDGLARCEDRQRFEEARKMGESGLRRYVLEFPQGRYVDEAQAEIGRLSTLPEPRNFTSAQVNTQPQVADQQKLRQYLMIGLSLVGVLALGIWTVNWVKKQQNRKNPRYSAYGFFVQQGDSVLATGAPRLSYDLALGFYKLAEEKQSTPEISRKIAQMLVKITAWEDSIRRQKMNDSIQVAEQLALSTQDIATEPPKNNREAIARSQELLKASEKALEQGNPALAEEYTRRVTEISPRNSAPVKQATQIMQTRISEERRFQDFMMEGEAEMKNGNYEQALAMFELAEKIKTTPELEERMKACRVILEKRSSQP